MVNYYNEKKKFQEVNTYLTLYLDVSGDDPGIRAQDLHKIHSERRCRRTKYCSNFNLKIKYIKGTQVGVNLH